MFLISNRKLYEAGSCTIVFSMKSIYISMHDKCLPSQTNLTFTMDGNTYAHTHTYIHLQLNCLKLLYSWRDHLARAEDESTGYVLPNHMLFQISEILPREAQGVLACCNPIPTLLRQQLQEVFMLVQKARDYNEEVISVINTGAYSMKILSMYVCVWT